MGNSDSSLDDTKFPNESIDGLLQSISIRLKEGMKDIDGISLTDATRLCDKLVILNAELLNREFPVKYIDDARMRTGLPAEVSRDCIPTEWLDQDTVTKNPVTTCDYKKLACWNIVKFLQEKVLLIKYVEDRYKLCQEQEETFRKLIMEKKSKGKYTESEWEEISKLLSSYNKHMIKKYAQLDTLLEQVEHNMTVDEMRELKDTIMELIENMNLKCSNYANSLRGFVFVPSMVRPSLAERIADTCNLNIPLTDEQTEALVKEYYASMPYGVSIAHLRVCREDKGKIYVIVNEKDEEVIRLPIADYGAIIQKVSDARKARIRQTRFIPEEDILVEDASTKRSLSRRSFRNIPIREEQVMLPPPLIPVRSSTSRRSFRNVPVQEEQVMFPPSLSRRPTVSRRSFRSVPEEEILVEDILPVSGKSTLSRRSFRNVPIGEEVILPPPPISRRSLLSTLSRRSPLRTQASMRQSRPISSRRISPLTQPLVPQGAVFSPSRSIVSEKTAIPTRIGPLAGSIVEDNIAHEIGNVTRSPLFDINPPPTRTNFQGFSN